MENDSFDLWITLKEKYPTFKDLMKARRDIYKIGLDDVMAVGIALTDNQMITLVRSIKKTFMMPKDAKITYFMGFNLIKIEIKKD